LPENQFQNFFYFGIFYEKTIHRALHPQQRLHPAAKTTSISSFFFGGHGRIRAYVYPAAHTYFHIQIIQIEADIAEEA